MNAPAPIPAARPVPYAGKSYTAFRVTQSPARTYPMPFAANACPTTADEARDAAITGPKTIDHRDNLLIRETDDATGKTTLHLFAIKRRARATYEWRGHEQVRVQPLYAEKVCEIDGNLIEGILA